MKSSEYDMLGCLHQNWYSTFEAKTIKCCSIEVLDLFYDYLAEDGIFIPQCDENEEPTTPKDKYIRNLMFKMKSAIDELGGSVFPKFNWTAPVDATWINAGLVKCSTPSEILLLLKASDRITYDIDHSTVTAREFDRKQHVKPSYIILKKFVMIDPAMEFRLFVFRKNIVKICQRDCSTFYPFLVSDSERLKQILIKFFEKSIRDKFLLQNYTVDVYIRNTNNVIIIDFNPVGEPTSALLFEWSDFESYFHLTPALTHLPTSNIEFAVVERANEVMISTKGSSRAPVDVTQAPDFYRFMDICKQQQNDAQSEYSDDIDSKLEEL